MKGVIGPQVRYPRESPEMADSWQGAKSQRFRGGKQHYTTPLHFDKGFVAQQSPAEDKGRKHLWQPPSQSVEFKKGVKTFLPILREQQQRPHGLMRVRYDPSQPKSRPQRLHIRDDRSSPTVDEIQQGIRIPEQPKDQLHRHYYIQDRMQRKIRARQPNKQAFFNDIQQLYQPIHSQDFGAIRSRIQRTIDVNRSIDNESTYSRYPLTSRRTGSFIEFDSLRPLV